MNKIYIPVKLKKAIEEVVKQAKEEEKKDIEYRKFNKESEIWNSYK